MCALYPLITPLLFPNELFPSTTHQVPTGEHPIHLFYWITCRRLRHCPLSRAKSYGPYGRASILPAVFSTWLSAIFLMDAPLGVCIMFRLFKSVVVTSVILFCLVCFCGVMRLPLSPPGRGCRPCHHHHLHIFSIFCLRVTTTTIKGNVCHSPFYRLVTDRNT